MASNLIIYLATALASAGVVVLVLQWRKECKRPMIKNNLNLIVQCGVMLGYALSLAFLHTDIRIAEPPLRYFLTLVCFILPLITLYGMFKHHRRMKGWGLIVMGATWLVIAYLYAIAPIYNAGWTLCVGYAVLAWVSLLRGDYSE